MCVTRQNVLLAFILLVVAGALWLTWMDQDPAPIAGAIPLPATRGIVTEGTIVSGLRYSIHVTDGYFWISPRSFIASTADRSGTVETVQVNLESRQTARAVNPHFLVAPPPASPPFYWALSPDGRWMLTVSELGDDLLYRAAALNGPQALTWANQFEGSSQPSWLSDSAGFVEWPFREGVQLVRVHWLDSGRADERRLDSVPTSVLTTPVPLLHPHIQITSLARPAGTAAAFLLPKPNAPPTTWKRVLVRTPRPLSKADTTTAVLSPQGDRLAWTVPFKSALPDITFQSTYPFVQFELRYTLALYQSAPDGSNLRPIGRRARPGLIFAPPKWTPDGKHLSFVFHQTLWLLPMDE